MDYAEFRAVWDEAIHSAGLLVYREQAEELVDLTNMARRYGLHVGDFGESRPKPFLASLAVEWNWDALQSARSRTTEEDTLTELLGRSSSRRRTSQPWLRVDLTFAGNVDLEKRLAFPVPEVWRRWIAEVGRRVDPLLPEPKTRSQGTMGWCGAPRAKVDFGPTGDPKLSGVTLKAWQAIQLPRHRDTPGRRADPSPQKQLTAFAKRAKNSLEGWSACLPLLLAPASRSGLH